MPTQTHQLAAIMFTDIVGYTALMGKDSAKVLDLVRISKEIQKPLVEKHNGTWLKEMGDGAMAQFGSALDAVSCAIEIQEMARAKFDGKLRIGIHLGDITIENNDVYGDGVNVAARLESIADPGGIYISDAIEKAIRGQSDVQAKYLGEVNLKNVDYGVRTYAIQGVGLPVPDLNQDKELSGRLLAEIKRRGVIRAGIMYILISLLLVFLQPFASTWLTLPDSFASMLLKLLVIGFPIAVYLAWLYERSPEGFISSNSEKSWQNPLAANKRKPFTGKSIIAILIIAIIGVYAYPTYFGMKENLSVDKVTNQVASITKKSIAVLAFTDLSQEHDQEHFSDGISEELYNRLTKIPELKVISTTSSFSYKGKNESVKRMGEQLKVTHILEGSVRKSGNSLRITPKLIKVSDGSNLWSDTYNYTLTLDNFLKIQEEIAETVVKELKIALRTNASKNIERKPTTDLETYTIYLKGQFHSNRSSEGANDTSIVLYEKAIKRDPNFAMAYVALARAYMRKNIGYGPNPKWEEAAYVAVGQALILDPDLAEAHVMLGMLNWSPGNNWRVEEAINELETARTLNSGLSSAYQYLSMVQYHIGLLDEALISGRNGVELDPLNHSAKRNVGWALLYQGKYTESLTVFQNLPETIGDAMNISMTAINLFYLNRVDEAIELIENNLIKYPNHSVINSAYAIFLASVGREDEAHERMQLAMDNAKNNIAMHHLYHNLAGASALMGQNDVAVKWLVKAADEGLICYPFYNLDPNLTSLKGNPAFETFMLKMKKKWEYHKSLYASIDQ